MQSYSVFESFVFLRGMRLHYNLLLLTAAVYIDGVLAGLQLEGDAQTTRSSG